MKKLLLIPFVALTLQAADNKLYDNAISLHVGYGSTAAGSANYSGLFYGFAFDKTLYGSDQAWSVDAIQWTVEYAKLQSDAENKVLAKPAREYALRLGANALWYIENYSNWTPFIKAGAGVQLLSGSETTKAGNYIFGTAGAGVEYQLRGDTAVVGQFTDQLTAAGENTLRLSVGLKYRFGQGF